MARNWIVIGDPTSSGGSVVSGSPFTDIDGIPVARVNDQATCPRHKGAYPIVDGDHTLIVDGHPVALHGSSLACGCKVLSAMQARVFVDAGGGAARVQAGESALGDDAQGTVGVERAGIAATVAATDQKSRYDASFVLKSSLTGRPLANRRYRILRPDGRYEEGVTDPHGATHSIESDCCEVLHVELGEEGP